MKKIFAIVLTLAMLLSLGAIMASAELPAGISFTPGKYGVENADDFEPVGDMAIQWDKDAATKLTLDGEMGTDEWAAYTNTTIDASNMVSWVGDPTTAPANWQITTYFVADSEWLYIGFYVVDPDFHYCTAQQRNGDNFQICIDFGGKLGQKVEEDPDNLTNPKNIFYSFGCVEDGAPIEIQRQESDNDGWLSEATAEDGEPTVKGAAKKTETGWSAEVALSFQMLYDDYEWKAWEEDSKIYVGGKNGPLKIGCCLYYLNYSNITNEDGSTKVDIDWAAGTTNGIADDAGVPQVSWTCYDNGVNLTLDITDDVTFASDDIVILGEGETEPPTEEDEEEPTEAPTAAPTDAPTEAPTDAPTDAPTEPVVDEGGCASVVGFGAVAVLAAAAAAFVLKKKD